ncbi:MAG: PAS domain S-box protein [Acidobacteriota bacterium]
MALNSVAFSKIRWVVIAIVAVIAASIPGVLTQSLIHPRLLIPFFFVAVLISTWQGGVRSGLLAAVLSLFVVSYPLVRSAEGHPDLPVPARLGVFTFVCLLIVALGEARNRSEAKAREADELQRITIHASPLAMLVLDLDLKVALWNPAAERMFGWSANDVAGQPLPIIPENLRVENEHRLRAQFQGEDLRRFNARQRKKDGSLIDVSISSATLRDAHGMITGVLLIMEEITDRKRSEEQIHFQASLLDQVRNAVIVVDLENRILLWNKHAETIYQWKAEEVHGRNVLDLIVPDDSRGAGQKNVEALKRTGHWEGEGVVRRKDGSKFPASFHGAVIRATNGEIIGLVGVHTDITERKRLFRDLKESDNRFRSFMDHMPGYAWIKDSEGSYVYMNKPLQDILPKHQDRWMGLTDFELWPPWIAGEYQKNDQRVLKHRRDLQTVEPWSLEDHDRYVLVSKFPILDSQSLATMVAGISIDITERKQAEQALDESRTHLQAILDNCPAMIFLKDVEGRYLRINKTFERTFNMSPEKVMGRTDAEVFSQELAAAFRATDARVLAAGCAMESEEEALYADGWHAYIVQKFPLRNAAGDIFAVGGISTDITERKRDEIEIKTQKEVLQTIFDHIPVLISFIGEDGRFKLINREWERTLGWSLDEMAHQDIDVLREQYPDPQDHQNVLNFIASANAKWAKFRTRVRDGRVIDTMWAHIRLSDGTSIGIGQDITEQERAHEALQESHNLQSAVVEATPDAVFVKDRQGRYQMINSAGAGFVGKPVEEIIGRDNTDLFLPEASREITRRDQEVMASGKAQTFEETVTAAGMTRTFLTTKDVYRDSKGTVRGLIGIAREITERKRTEERLQEYEKAVEGLEEMIAVVDRDYRYLLANRAFLRYRGLEREQVVGHLVSEVVGEEVFEEVIRPKVDECLQGKTVNYERKFAYPELGERDLFITYFPVEGPDGVDRVVAILRDITERKRAEEALRESEERFSRAFHSSPAALSISGLEDGRLMEVNMAYLELTGYSQSEVLGRTSLELGLWANPEHRMKMAQTLRERGPVRDLETQFRKKSGEVRNVLLSVELIELRATPCVLGIVQDVTDRKRAEEALRASEERYRDLVENAHDIIYSHDLEGNYTAVNKAVEQITGYSREEALKMNVAQIIAPEHLEQARSMIRRKLAGEKEPVYNLEIVAKDGRRVAFEVNTRLIHQDGVPVGIHGIARDVTARKRAQEELRESEERYRDLVENSTELICTHDLDGLILSANRAAIEVLGYDRKDHLGKKNIRDILPPEYRAEFPGYLTRLRKTGVATGLMRVQTKSGERRIWEYRNTLRTEGVVKPIVRGMARDITERRKAEENLKATSDQLRALSASLRSAREEEGTRIARELHDELGSSLTGLRFDLEEVHKSLSRFGDEAAISTLQEKIANMTRLTDGTINTVKRISSELRPSLLDDLGLVAAVEWEAQQFATRSGIPCRCHCFVEHLDLSRERATAVFRVFQEALTNILRHAKATRVNVTMTEEEAELVLEVRDDGSGITAAERADPRSLGLTGMRERVHLAGGTIEITGAAGVGTVLTVRVPGRAED